MTKIKIAGVAIVALLAGVMSGCGGSDKPEIAILVPSADHGWTGAVLDYAQAFADENNTDDSAYQFVVYTSDGSEGQITQMETIVARGSSQVAGVVILPWDSGAEAGVNALANSDIPFIMVDRLISNDTIDASASHIGDVRGNNEMIGELTAQRFIEKGLQIGDPILVMPGDNSSVPIYRNSGFQSVLLENGWTQEQIDEAIYETDYTGWSRDTSYDLFVSWITQTYAAGNLGNYKWVFTHDSEIALGILEALASTEIADAAKTLFAETVISLGSSSGLEEMYQVLRGTHSRQSEYEVYVGGMDLFDITYPPSMIVDGIEDMINYLTDGTPVPNDGDHVIAVELVDRDNVANYTGF